MAKMLPFNDEWQFAFTCTEDFLLGRVSGEPVRLPHTVKLLPWKCAMKEMYETVCGYTRTFFADPAWADKEVRLVLEGAGHYPEVFLNGTPVAPEWDAHSGYTAQSFLLLGLRCGEENRISVRLDTRESLNQPPFGFLMDYLCYGGLYREASLVVAAPCHMADVFPIAQADGQARVQVTLSKEPQEGDMLELLVPELGIELQVPAQKDSVLSFRAQAEVWDVEQPKLYDYTLTLRRQGQELDCRLGRLGFRDAEFRPEGFFLNGKPLQLRGLNRHQSYPYIGYAAPRGMQYDEAEYLKYTLGLNFVRTSHYPQSQHFIDRCDEIGLLVFTEIPGWQHIGDEQWQDRALENVRQMVLQYRHHPSIILWGVRINESQDNDPLYEKTNALAHALDPSRQTSGVRFIQHSHLLEDVYAYNDFTKNGTGYGLLKKSSATTQTGHGYFVSECNGHMFPTKNQDDELHRLTHALRHAQVQSDAASDPEIAGCTGWCMADYNTHTDFGTGDSICYHGVADGFRNNKLAGCFYGSQQDARPVLVVASDMNKGERPGSVLDEVYVFTNAEKVRLSKGGEVIGDYGPDEKDFPGLPHPPIKIDDFVGNLLVSQEGYPQEVADRIKTCLFAARDYGMDHLPPEIQAIMGDLVMNHGLTPERGVELFNNYIGGWGQRNGLWRFTAIRNGQPAEYVEKGAYASPRLLAYADRQELLEGPSYDMVLVHLEARDSLGNRIPTASDAIALSTEGPIEVVGPTLVALEGGAFGTFVRTTGQAGRGILKLFSPTLGEETIPFTVTKA